MAHKKLTPREKRKVHIRKKIFGTTERPRLTVFRSNRYLYAQIIDDTRGMTVASASSLAEGGSSAKAAEGVGQVIAERAKQANVNRVVFDKNGYRFHGVVRFLADAARKGGLEF